jgi:hypothetical protein
MTTRKQQLNNAGIAQANKVFAYDTSVAQIQKVHDSAKEIGIVECMEKLESMQAMQSMFNEAAHTPERAAAIVLEAARRLWPSEFEEVR